MNAKYVVALILALQVSMSLCDVQAPSQELVDKYTGLKDTFKRRVIIAMGKLQEATAPLMEGASKNERAQEVRDYIENLQAKPEFQSAVKVLTSLVSEAAPLVDTARSAILGWYEQNFRQQYGGTLDEGITNIKAFLDKYLPAE